MGLGEDSRGAPPSWIQLSFVNINILRGLDFGAKMCDPLTRAIIHTIGAMFVDNTDLYCEYEPIMKPDELFSQLQLEVMQ